MRVRSLGWGDALEMEMATHSIFLLGKSHGQRSLVGYSPRSRKESDKTERLSMHEHTKAPGRVWSIWCEYPHMLEMTHIPIFSYIYY